MTGEEDGWTRGNREREIVYANQRQHGANIDGGTESVGVPTEDFNSWTHAKIKAASDAFDSGKAIEVSADWEKLATGFSKALDDFKRSFDVAVGAQWTGEGAEAAKQGISDYKSHAEKVSDGLSLMATKPAEVETAMTQIKGLMPEVVQVQQPKEHTQAAYEQYYAQQALADQKQDEARMIMRNVWSPVSQQAGSGLLPSLPPRSSPMQRPCRSTRRHRCPDWAAARTSSPTRSNPSMKPQFVQLPLRPWPIHRKHPLPVLAAQAVPQPQLVRRVAPLERALAAPLQQPPRPAQAVERAPDRRRVATPLRPDPTPARYPAPTGSDDGASRPLTRTKRRTRSPTSGHSLPGRLSPAPTRRVRVWAFPLPRHLPRCPAWVLPSRRP
ncbi:hypothetical protein E3G68_002797 [Mycobacteroides abscessus]|nr:hypothetical protein [Mycobacteroides abscessus]MBE5478550.1 hypothetical protein [Mycobacteroides abscessus]MBE5489723.1 hypothetical protein [Mycobacteroides abscessus]